MKKTAAFLLFLLYAEYSVACTTFLIHKGSSLLFGRNYDWVTGNGMVLINHRNLKKLVSQKEAKALEWTSAYGSITFNQYGKEAPTGGMNEAGLVVELMWLDETKYPDPDSRPALGVLQWIQYQLDCAETVEEVISSERAVRISPGGPPLHYLVADATGAAATIEFLDGKMVVHEGGSLPHPVLTNSTYSRSLTTYQKTAGVDVADNSLQRFAQACAMVGAVQKLSPDQSSNAALIDYSFSVLDKVAQGSFTQWRIIYDIANKNIYFKTNGPQGRNISFDAVDFGCGGPTLAYPLSQNASGSIAGLFTALSYEGNNRLIERSAFESRSHVQISAAEVAEAANYFSMPKCK